MLALSTSVIDGREVESLGSDSDDRSACLAADVLVIQQALDVCTRALSDAGRVPNTSTKVLSWLKQCGAVDVLDGGGIVLARHAVLHGIRVSEAVPERSLREKRSTLELQADCVQSGWQFADYKQASIDGRKLVDGNPRKYYELVLQCPEELLNYEQEGCFHHRQSENYYLCIELAIASLPGEVAEIPVNKKKGFYVELRHFLEGKTDADPRLQPEEQGLEEQDPEEQEQGRRTGSSLLTVFPFDCADRKRRRRTRAAPANAKSRPKASAEVVDLLSSAESDAARASHVNDSEGWRCTFS